MVYSILLSSGFLPYILLRNQYAECEKQLLRSDFFFKQQYLFTQAPILVWLQEYFFCLGKKVYEVICVQNTALL